MLTAQDFNLLIEAIEAWERASQEGRMMGSLLGSMLCRDDEEAKRNMAIQEEKWKREAEADSRNRKERGVILRAKLIQMRDSAAADELIAGSASS